MNGLDLLIKWLKEIQEGRQPEIPYNLHPLVRLLHNEVGTTTALEWLEDLRKYAINNN